MKTNKFNISKTPYPAILKCGKVKKMNTDVFDHSEKYIDSIESLDEGKYWMGSKTSNTRCNNFTLFGADQTRADDTREKK